MQFSDLMGVHARCWDLDRACPVVVVVAKIVGQLLNYLFAQGRVVQGNVEMSREDTALGSELRNQIEIVFLIRSFILYELGVNHTARWWVDQLTSPIVNKEPL